MRTITEEMEVESERARMLPPDTLCLLLRRDNRTYWASGFHTSNPLGLEDAHIFTVGYAINNCGQASIIHLFTDNGVTVTPTPSSDGKKCTLSQALSGTVIELLRAAPLNPLARAHALNELKQAIPDNCWTFEQITEWVEKNITPTRKQPVSPPVRARNRVVAFSIEVTRRHTELGRCSYSVGVSGTDEIGITEAQIRVALDGAGSVDEILESLNNDIEEAAGEMELDDYEDYEYDGYDMAATDNHETDYRQDRLRQLLISWLAENEPDRFEEFE